MIKYISILVIIPIVIGLKIKTHFLKTNIFNDTMICIVQNKGCSSSFSCSNKARNQLEMLFASDTCFENNKELNYVLFLKSFNFMHNISNSLSFSRKKDLLSINFFYKENNISFQFSQNKNQIRLENIDNLNHLKNLIYCVKHDY